MRRLLIPGSLTLVNARVSLAAGLLLLPAVFAMGCGAAGDVGHQAAANFIGPFMGITETTFGGSIFTGTNCADAIGLAQRVYDKDKDARLALKADVEKYRNDDGFKEKFSVVVEMTQQEAFTKFSEKCPEESKAFDTLVDNMGEELGLGDSAPPYPPEK